MIINKVTSWFLFFLSDLFTSSSLKLISLMLELLVIFASYSLTVITLKVRYLLDFCFLKLVIWLESLSLHLLRLFKISEFVVVSSGMSSNSINFVSIYKYTLEYY